MYLSSTETRICHRDIELLGISSIGFAQNAIHDFRNTHGTRSGNVFDKRHKNSKKFRPLLACAGLLESIFIANALSSSSQNMVRI